MNRTRDSGRKRRRNGRGRKRWCRLRRVSECRGRWVLIRRTDLQYYVFSRTSVLNVTNTSWCSLSLALRRRRAPTVIRSALVENTPAREFAHTNISGEKMPKFPANIIQISRTRRQEARRVRKRIESERSAKVKQREFRIFAHM